MPILIMGADGNMGKRYAAILKFLKKDVIGVDAHHSPEDVKRCVRAADGIIIATPTATHLKLIKGLRRYKKPILCEKPFSKNIRELAQVLEDYHRSETPLNMVYQYKELVGSKAVGDSEYDYFRHGSDGLLWDCIQIIGLAKGNVTIREESPVWRCQINGERLSLNMMDVAYVTHVKKWLARPGQALGEILDVHMKVADLEKGVLSGRNN
jgi:hypothetical protein